MRPSFTLRRTRPLPAAAGLAALAAPAAGWGVLTTSTTATAHSTPPPVLVSLDRPDRARVGYGAPLTVAGHAPLEDRGRTVLLQYAPLGRSRWSTLRSGKVHVNGTFRMVTHLTRSGSVRVFAGIAPVTGGAPRLVSVVSRLVLAHGAFDGGRIAGTVLPRVAGRLVVLEVGTRRGWHRVAAVRTRRDGHFAISDTTSAGRVRVRFGGDRISAAAAATGRRLLFHDGVASWYEDGGTTACGFHAGLGVAHRWLPCGTHVTFRYGGRIVTATVDDRGPFVGGRDWDLNQNTAAALGFGGVDTVQASAG